ncbi:MAG TPA: zinc dependent phospholipase C family protein [Chitinophagales bacterium]|nr:zinc dependent phospholipase C family protein [Chitinophagales bacterium]
MRIAIGLVVAALLATSVLLYQRSNAWGFWAHKRINRIAVFTLPPQMIGFFKENIEHITEHAVDPDKRRYADPLEAPRHYIDIDRYDVAPFDAVPRRWDSAVAKYSIDTLNAHGIVPWHINLMMYQLTEAFKSKSKYRVLRLVSDIGHYIGDAHVPLHCTKNYNGQLTGQHGIHGFWESRIPELFGEDYDYFVGKAEYWERPNERIWEIILESASQVDSVLRIERQLNEQFPSDKKYTYEQRGETTVRTYSREYSDAYDKALNRMSERKLRKSIIALGSVWYTCWVNAGSPDLGALREIPPTPEEIEEAKQLEASWRQGKQQGREHED